MSRRTDQCVDTKIAHIEQSSVAGAASLHGAIIPCDDELYESSFTPHEFNEHVRAASLKRYQYMQLIIQRTWEVIEPHELSPRTLELLSLSPHLWPLLKKETYDLGSPDEAGGYAPLLFLRARRMRELERELAFDSPKKEFLACAAIFYNKKDQLLHGRKAFEQFRATCDGELYKIYKCDTCKHAWKVRQLGGPLISTTVMVPEAMAHPEKWPERKVPADLLVPRNALCRPLP